MSVEGDNFTDREIETKRLKLNFENGINSILISPRRMGKTSLVKKVISMIDEPKIKVVYMDIYNAAQSLTVMRNLLRQSSRPPLQKSTPWLRMPRSSSQASHQKSHFLPI